MPETSFFMHIALFFLNRYKIFHFFKNQLACSKFYVKFLISRARDKKRNKRYAWNLIDYTQDILIHIYDIDFVSNCFIF